MAKFLISVISEISGIYNLNKKARIGGLLNKDFISLICFDL